MAGDVSSDMSVDGSGLEPIFETCVVRLEPHVSAVWITTVGVVCVCCVELFLFCTVVVLLGCVVTCRLVLFIVRGFGCFLVW